MRYFFCFIIVLILTASDAVGQRRRDEPSPEEERELAREKNKKTEAEVLFLEAEKHYLLEDYARAAPLFAEAAGLSEAQGIRVKWAEALSQTGKPEDLDKAAALIQEVLKTETKVTDYYLIAARIQAARNNYEGAADWLEKMTTTIPRSEEWLYELASYHQLSGRREKALDALERTEKQFGTNEQTTFQKAEILESLGRKQAAEDEFRKLMATDPGEVRYAMALAELLAGRGEAQRAVAVLEDFIDRGGSAGYAHAMLSELHLGLWQLDKAFRHAEPVMTDNEVETQDRIAMLRMLMNTLDPKRPKDPFAAEHLRRLYALLAKDPNGEIHRLGGDLFYLLGEKHEAARLYRLAIGSGLMQFQVWSALFSMDADENQFDSLIAHTETALEYFPNMSEAWYFNGFGHMRKKKYTAARTSLEQALKLNPEPPLKSEIHALLGEVWQALKEYEKADQAFEASLAINPANPQVMNNYSYYLALRKAKLPRAEELALQLVRNHPDVPAYSDTYGWILFQAGKYKEARAILQPLAESGKASATHLEHYGDTLLMLGLTDEAVRIWEKALSMNSRNDALRSKILNRKLN